MSTSSNDLEDKLLVYIGIGDYSNHPSCASGYYLEYLKHKYGTDLVLETLTKLLEQHGI